MWSDKAATMHDDRDEEMITEHKLAKKEMCVCIYPQVACREVLILLCKMDLEQLVCISQESLQTHTDTCTHTRNDVT